MVKAMGDYRVPNEGQYNGKSNEEIILGIHRLSTEGISKIKDSTVPETVPEVKEESSLHSTFIKDIVGFSLGIGASLLIAIGTGCIQKPAVPKKQILWLLVYCLMILAFSVTNYAGVTFIAVGVAGCVRRSVNLIGITILATLLLKEQLTRVKIIAVLLSLVGVIIMIQPWYNSPAKETETENHDVTTNTSLLNQVTFTTLHLYGSYENITEVTTQKLPTEDDSNDDWIGYLLSVVAGVVATIAGVAQKGKLSGIDPLTLNVWAGLSGAIVSVCISAAAEDMRFSSETDDIIFVVVQSLTWGAAAVMAIWAVSLTSPLVMTLAVAMQIVFLLIGQYTVLSDIQPGIGNWVELFGAVLVVMSAMMPSAWQIIQVKLNPVCMKPTRSGNEDHEPEYYSTYL